MFVGLAIAKAHAWQTFFACDKQNVVVTQCLSWWPNVQACLTSKIQNVCQSLLVRLAVALRSIINGQDHVNYFVNSPLSCKRANISKILNNSRLKMIQHIKSELAHPLAKLMMLIFG